MIVTNYSDARAKLATYMDKVTDDRDEVHITRKGRPDVVLISADELASWRETIYLYRSPANAGRLEEAFARAERGEVITSTLEDLKREVGLAV